MLWDCIAQLRDLARTPFQQSHGHPTACSQGQLTGLYCLAECQKQLPSKTMKSLLVRTKMDLFPGTQVSLWEWGELYSKLNRKNVICWQLHFTLRQWQERGFTDAWASFCGGALVLFVSLCSCRNLQHWIMVQIDTQQKEALANARMDFKQDWLTQKGSASHGASLPWQREELGIFCFQLLQAGRNV